MLEKSKSELIGLWKSDAEKTLGSMREVEGINGTVRKKFENDYFGHLIAEFTGEKGRVYFDRDEENVQAMKVFAPYKLLKENSEEFVIQYYDDYCAEEVTKVLRREGDCYWLTVPKWKFREYFRRVD
jgi:hypothetical protein